MSAILKGAIAALLLGVSLAGYGLWEMSIQRRFDTEAVVASGTVGSAVFDNSRHRDTHVVHYSDWRGNEYSIVVDVHAGLVEGLGEARRGDRVDVEYLESSPRRARLHGDLHTPAWLWLVPAGGLIGLGLIGLSASRNWVTDPDGSVRRVYEDTQAVCDVA